MNRPTKTVVALLTALSATAASVAIAEPAQAAVPSCMNVYQNKLTHGIQINSTCDRTIWIKVKWAFGSDSACKAVVPYKYNYYPRPNRFARYDGAYRC
ncbi:hypothetical protein GCM10011512_05250 [Tersicoccus solisilvae]|uniref:Uncharacterized protein n=1 Tax=Tersicoccus solisilvae TaxID=1882339 RepID=A0ABQ1NRC1_9MICC|nr:hypothetical protein [Tersicoccus solisilvae]GGC81501.1 hypothetical protein GCM10011512_05250 [Tersicoccus solisilvae]